MEKKTPKGIRKMVYEQNEIITKETEIIKDQVEVPELKSKNNQ